LIGREQRSRAEHGEKEELGFGFHGKFQQGFKDAANSATTGGMGVNDGRA
jgi:hypothetical protein